MNNLPGPKRKRRKLQRESTASLLAQMGVSVDRIRREKEQAVREQALNKAPKKTRP